MESRRPEACSRLSLESGDPLAGTASTAQGYLLIEHNGPWGKKILRDAPFTDPDGTDTRLGNLLRPLLEPLEITPLLVRRPGTQHGVPSPAAVMLVAVGPDGGCGARTAVRALSQIAGWNVRALLAELRAGRVPAGWEPLATQYLVCTQALRDACCGELGRPIAAALAAADAAGTWEVSHLGGHRLAANVLVVPDGVVYGRMDREDVAPLVAAHAEGRLLVGKMRGRAALAHPVQAAEVAVRRASGADGAAALRLMGVETDGVRTTTSWEVADRTLRVTVETTSPDGPPRPASCGAEPGPPPARHEVVAVEDGPARPLVGTA
ncbi:sucrase ferredoxin [Georgenia sp. AZ-5]|uniref:sucrase ferredoxin n=1 Tax=Georgenia sp. AZ-5 TaxID=3367526 RepID=UPI0037550CCF